MLQGTRAGLQSFNSPPGAATQATNDSSPTTGPEKLLLRYCNYLDLPPNVQAICSDIIIAARQHGIADGRSPVSIAGGAIYFTCYLLGIQKPIQDISTVAGVNEGTVKLVYRDYYLEKEMLVKEDWINDGRADISRLLPEEKKSIEDNTIDPFTNITGSYLGLLSSLLPSDPRLYNAQCQHGRARIGHLEILISQWSSL